MFSSVCNKDNFTHFLASNALRPMELQIGQFQQTNKNISNLCVFACHFIQSNHISRLHNRTSLRQELMHKFAKALYLTASDPCLDDCILASQFR